MFADRHSLAGGCYFVGIGGVSMSALARLLHERGVPVRGCDDAEGHFTRELKAAGIPVALGEDEEIFEDTVVYTGAFEETRPCLVRARQAGKRLFARAEFLGLLASTFPSVISVAGCHGKTTTCCMLTHIFAAARREFTAHIGGEDLQFGNYYRAGAAARASPRV